MERKLLRRTGKSRSVALKAYPTVCVWCGLAIPDLLEAAHLDHNRGNDDPKNLVFLCLTHHRMLDLGLIPKEFVRELRDRPNKADWSILINAGKKSQKSLEVKSKNQKSVFSTLQKESELEKIVIKRRDAALKAWATRRYQNPEKFGAPTKRDKTILKKNSTPKKKVKIENSSIKRSLAAYRAQLTRKKKDSKKYGRVTNELINKIKKLEKDLKN